MQIVSTGLHEAIDVHLCSSLPFGLPLWSYTEPVHTPSCVMGKTKAQRESLAKATAASKKRIADDKLRIQRKEYNNESE